MAGLPLYRKLQSGKEAILRGNIPRAPFDSKFYTFVLVVKSHSFGMTNLLCKNVYLLKVLFLISVFILIILQVVLADSYFQEDRLYYHKYQNSWLGPVSFDKLEDITKESDSIWYDGLCPNHQAPEYCANHGFAFIELIQQRDSIRKDHFIKTILGCKNCFAFNRPLAKLKTIS